MWQLGLTGPAVTTITATTGTTDIIHRMVKLIIINMEVTRSGE